jgi:hypothetical protein
MRNLIKSGLVIAFVCAYMASARGEDAGCDGKPITAHHYQQQAADVLQPRHLEMVRSYSGNGKLEISICNADLRVRTQPEAHELKVMVEMERQSDGHPASDYIRTFQVAPDGGVIHLDFPGDTHATVTLVMPMGAGSANEFNVGKGNLDFNAMGSAGSREINVGMGHMNLLVDNDKSYADMEVNVGMGSLHDHRPGGHDGHFVVSKNYSGTGAGSLEVNVGMGSLDIRQE